MTETIPYWKSNRFLKVFVYHKGEEGCIVCPDENIKLSMDRAPPPMRDPPANERARNPPPGRKKKEEKEDFLMNVIDGGLKTVETWRKFRAWMDSPPPAPAPPKAVTSSVEQPDAGPEPFDIQDIPKTIRKLGLPLAAKMFEKWFAGDLNYSLTNEETVPEINQNGAPYKASMIDMTSISIKWVLQFERAKIAKDLLTQHALLTTIKATEALTKILDKHKSNAVLMPGLTYGKDIQKIHKEFQFQRSLVEGTLAQKLEQFLEREMQHRGIPDELTFILGSFNLNAAVSRATFHRVSGGHLALVTHIYIYARDGFTFTDEKNKSSQYLGHWNRDTVAIVPSHQVVINMMHIKSAGYTVNRHYWRGDEGALHPVRNSDFREWQNKYGRGGDYIIYTDAISVMLHTPIQIYLPA